ncbi:class I SAM-dependent methyltransferase [Bradyrhizobium sp. STM 3562]|uniref:class I SAM-dependent methyltransferase n=1 Tax=Bradyrhizobium sp. STM 3562 TaxID=578924 RepID=UPI00388E6D6A
MTDRMSHWENVYTSKAEDEVSWFQENPAISLRLIGDANATRDSRIIDVGGGASRLADALLEQGFRAITVLDISAAALETAKMRLGERSAEVDWIVADITQWTPSQIYDVWHDRAAFHFLTEPADRAAYANALRSATAPGSQVIIGTFALDGPERCSGLPVQRYDSSSLAQTLGPAFELADSSTEAHRTPWGAIQRFQFSRFRRV